MATMEAAGVIEFARHKIEKDRQAHARAWAELVQQVAETGGVDDQAIKKLCKSPEDFARLDADVKRARDLLALRPVARGITAAQERARLAGEAVGAHAEKKRAFLAAWELENARLLHRSADASADLTDALRARDALIAAASELLRRRWYALPSEEAAATKALAKAEQGLETARLPIDERVAGLEATIERRVRAGWPLAGRNVEPPGDVASRAEALAPWQAELERLRASTVEAEGHLAEGRLAAARRALEVLSAERAELLARVVGA